MKIAVIGSRSFTDYERLKNLLDQMENISEIVSGGAMGADALGKRYALENNIKYTEFLPKFKTDNTVPYHPKWFFERNKDIVNHADTILAFWDQKSTGTKHAIDYAMKQNLIGKKKVHVIKI